MVDAQSNFPDPSVDRDRQLADRLRALYPELENAELLAAEQNLRAYISLAFRIHEKGQPNPQVGPLTGGTGTLSCGTPEKGGIKPEGQ